MQATDDMREFMLVVRRALLLVVRWIERRYGYAETKRATPGDVSGCGGYVKRD